MKTLLATFLAVITLAWGWDQFYISSVSQGAMPWLIRQQALLLSGLWSISLMSLVMILATRPAWLEKPLGGMDRVYRLHKWAGILAIVFAAAHWLVDLSGDILKALIGKAGRPGRPDLSALAEAARPFAKDLGEWVIYALIIMLAITLWRRFPYKFWRYIHRAMPALYIILVFHAVVLAPAAYWAQPIGVLLAVLLAVGLISSGIILAGQIGKSRKTQGSVVHVSHHGPTVTEVTCQLGPEWSGHRAGQFAFVTFGRTEGPHPFTIASANRNDRSVTFQIKKLGDYTKRLADTLTPGQTATIEGPYGCFDLARSDPNARQIWIAGGIGITPFLAWLESLRNNKVNTYCAELHYFVRNASTDPFVGKLETLCMELVNIRLHVHSSDGPNPASCSSLLNEGLWERRPEVWFCGPSGLAKSLKSEISTKWRGKFKFHQEAFEMR